MKSKTLALTILVFLVLVSLFQILYYYPRLPYRVASHFGFSGKPDGWSSREVFLIMNIALVVFMGGLFWLSGWLPRKLPDSWINLPHKDYWLAPERRDSTFETYAVYLYWFGNATLLLFLFLFNSTYRANLMSHPEFGQDVLIYFGLYILFIIYWTIKFYREFRVRPENDTTSFGRTS